MKSSTNRTVLQAS